MCGQMYIHTYILNVHIYIHNQWLTCVAVCRWLEEQKNQEQDDETERNQSRCAPHCEFTISEAVVMPQTFPRKDDDGMYMPWYIPRIKLALRS